MNKTQNIQWLQTDGQISPCFRVSIPVSSFDIIILISLGGGLGGTLLAELLIIGAID